MGVDENANYSFLSAQKIRNELIENLIKEEDYQKKDEKKKEIIKTCSSYKDFCNIVECINMKPIKTYENKINYDEYVNARYNVSHWKSDLIQKKNIKDNLTFIKNQIKQLSKEKSSLSSNDQKEKCSHELQQFIKILKKNKKNYSGFIMSTYNCDDVKDTLSFIKRVIPNLFDYTPDIEPEENDNKEPETVDNFSLLKSLIHFLYDLSQFWMDNKFSLFFNADELKDIRSNCTTIVEEIKRISNRTAGSSKQQLTQLNFIKNAFSK